MTSYYSKKENAIKKLDTNGILCNRNITKYFISKNYTSFLQTINKSSKKDFYEYIYDDKPVKLFFDIEIYKENTPGHFEKYKPFLEDTFIRVERYLQSLEKNIVISKIVLESHNEKKKSFHVIYNLKDQNNVELVFKCVADLKVLWLSLIHI